MDNVYFYFFFVGGQIVLNLKASYRGNNIPFDDLNVVFFSNSVSKLFKTQLLFSSTLLFIVTLGEDDLQ